MFKDWVYSCSQHHQEACSCVADILVGSDIKHNIERYQIKVLGRARKRDDRIRVPPGHFGGGRPEKLIAGGDM